LSSKAVHKGAAKGIQHGWGQDGGLVPAGSCRITSHRGKPRVQSSCKGRSKVLVVVVVWWDGLQEWQERSV
jgi:hypothetical protein